MLDFLFLLLASLGGFFIGNRVSERKYRGALEAGINNMAAKCAIAVDMAVRQSYIAGGRDKASGTYDVDAWATYVHINGIEGFDEVIEAEVA
jgi:hypothetical protein